MIDAGGARDAQTGGEPDARRGGSRRSGPGIDGVSGFLEMRWVDPASVRLTIRPDLINASGLLSGVVAYALIDYCMGSALWAQTAEHELIATINIAINYIQTATEGEIVCRSSVDRRNRTSATLRSEVRHDDGRLLATAIGSYAIFVRRDGGGGGSRHDRADGGGGGGSRRDRADGGGGGGSRRDRADGGGGGGSRPGGADGGGGGADGGGGPGPDGADGARRDDDGRT